MMKYIKIVLFFGIFNSYGQAFDKLKEKTQIENTIKFMVDAWAQGDAQKFATPFTTDADFTVWYGLKLNGKEEIAFGHNIIFKSFYANTTWNLEIDKIRFLGEDTALVHASGSVTTKGDSIPEEPDAIPLIVFNKVDGEWKIVALQNTPYAVNEFRANGDINRMKSIARENRDK